MKNEYDNFDNIADFNNLYKAHKECRKGKLWKDSVASYDLKALESTLYLKHLLNTEEYKISKYHCFRINERGKTRDIKSTQYKDRVVQKVLCDNIFTPYINKKMIYDNGASIKGKGTDFSINRLKTHMQRFYRKHGTDGYVLVCDMQKYFDSIRHELLQNIYAKYFDDEKILSLIKMIHDSIPGGVGVPLGNQLSQFDALLAADSLDHMIKEELRIKYYGRYMDDFYLIHEDKEYLKYCRQKIEEKAAELGLKLNQKKTKIVPIRVGINYLGFHYYLTETGKVVVRIKTKSKNRMRTKLRKYKKKLKEGKMSLRDIEDGYRSWKAHAKRGNTYYMLQNMDRYYFNLFKEYYPNKGGIKQWHKNYQHYQSVH